MADSAASRAQTTETSPNTSCNASCTKLLVAHTTVLMLLQVISQTAIQEFKQGSAERGRSMLESCLRNYPTRLDVWSQYLDQASLCESAHLRMCSSLTCSIMQVHCHCHAPGIARRNTQSESKFCIAMRQIEYVQHVSTSSTKEVCLVRLGHQVRLCT